MAHHRTWHWSRRLLLTVVVSAGIVAALVAATVFKGQSPLEGWIGSQLKSITNSYINPTLSFDSLDYQAPLTVKVKNLKLTADDPRGVGKKLDILAAGEATITLAEVPQRGKPIVIEKITVNQPLFQAVAMGRKDKRLVGFTGMVRQDMLDSATQPAEAKRKLSEFLQMRTIEIVDGKVVYDPQVRRTEPMVLDQINTRLDVVPGENGQYNLKLGLNRKPLFDLNTSAKLNLDTMTLTDAKLDLTGELADKNYSYLPPQLQKFLRQHDVRGQLVGEITGTLPIGRPRDGDLTGSVVLKNANIKFVDYHVPLDDFLIRAKLAKGKLFVPEIKLWALHGGIWIGGEVELNDAMDSQFTLQMLEMRVDELFLNEDGSPAVDPSVAGRLNIGLTARVPLAALLPRFSRRAELATTRPQLMANVPPLPTTEWGAGTAHIDHGQLVKFPLMKEITAAISAGQRSRAEQADAKFVFEGDRVKFTDLRFESDLVAARGGGTITFDRKVDLVLNGGPLKKVQSMLGVVGDAFGLVTDRISTYHVTGTVQQPDVKMRMGGYTAAPKGDAEEVMKAVAAPK